MENSSGMKFLDENFSRMKFSVETAKWNQQMKSVVQAANEMKTDMGALIMEILSGMILN